MRKVRMIALGPVAERHSSATPGLEGVKSLRRLGGQPWSDHAPKGVDPDQFARDQDRAAPLVLEIRHKGEQAVAELIRVRSPNVCISIFFLGMSPGESMEGFIARVRNEAMIASWCCDLRE